MTMHYRGVGQSQISPGVFPQNPQQSPAATSVVAVATPGTTVPSANIAARVALPTCLTLAQVQLMSACFGKTAPPGMDQQYFEQACASATANKLFGLPYCPSEQLPAVPQCLDAGWAANVSYCEQYPGNNGPDSAKNAICWAARKSPPLYNALRATPVCGGQGPNIIDEPVQEEPPATAEPNYMLWGGLALLLVAAGGGVYYYTRKSSKPMVANGWRRRQKAMARRKKRRRRR